MFKHDESFLNKFKLCCDYMQSNATNFKALKYSCNGRNYFSKERIIIANVPADTKTSDHRTLKQKLLC